MTQDEEKEEQPLSTVEQLAAFVRSIVRNDDPVGTVYSQVIVGQFKEPDPTIGTFHEFFRDCPGCQKETRWAFTQMNRYVDGECEECEYPETFGSWDEVMEVVNDDN